MSSSVVYISEGGTVPAENNLESNLQERKPAVLKKGGRKGRRKDLVVKVPNGTVVDAQPSVLPSPPLTRVGTNESRSTRAGVSSLRRVAADNDGDEKEEMDITAWRESTQGADNDDDLLPQEEIEVEDEEQYLDGDEGFEPKEPEPRGEQAWTSLSAAAIAASQPNRNFIPPSLRVDVPPNGSSPPLLDGMSPLSSHGHPDEVDLESQQHRIDTLGSRAGSSKRLVPKSSYYYGPPPPDAAFGTDPIGQIGVHHPREVIRIERDYSGGEIIQFAPVYPLEFEGRISATRFLESINSVNEILISAHSLSHSCLDNALAFFTLQLSKLVKTSHYEKEMRRLKQLMDNLNRETFNPVGLNMVWPRKVAFMFLEIEYY
jgi:hypothetical protein